ncbi:MAG: hypothetical protein LBK73_15990 [Treponema sp.]|jgi:hypothetical protein|nr:hypothetical protein [Treponema sp.]
MANKKFWLGMLVMVLAFGMAVVGCDNGNGGDTNYFDTLNLSNSTPNATTLSARGLTRSQFTDIRDAARGGFRGWALDEEGALVMAWTGRNVSSFNSVADTLDAISGEEERGIESGVYWAMGFGNHGGEYALSFCSTSFSENGFYLPAGSMMASFY